MDRKTPSQGLTDLMTVRVTLSHALKLDAHARICIIMHGYLHIMIDGNETRSRCCKRYGYRCRVYS